jgi:hypothetical protein
MQYPIQTQLIVTNTRDNIVTCHTVTKMRVWIGNWIYWILTGRNYN